MTAFDRVARRAWEGNILFSALLELTYRCNLDCYFCYNDVGLRGVSLKLADYYKLLDDLREMQVMNLVLSGGEPLAHPDFFSVGGRGRELGFLVRVKSNGHALGEKLARRVKAEVDPYEVEVSLHGARAETHDRQTRVPGSFDRLMANLRHMQEAGLRVKINSTLTAWNEREIEGMYAIADSLGVKLRFDPVVTPKDDGDRSVQAIAATPDGMVRLFRLQTERDAARRQGSLDAAKEDPHPGAGMSNHGDDGLPAPQGRTHCGAGTATIAVDPYGNVYPCVQWRSAIGSLHGSSIKEIWRGSHELETIRDSQPQVKRLVDSFGSRGAFMAYCPGLAWATNGDPLQVYPQALRKMELSERARAEEMTAPEQFVYTAREK